MRKLTNALEIIDRELRSDPSYAAGVAWEREKLRAAQVVYDARTAVGMTQKQLAVLVGTTQSVIARIEDADYEGHTVKMLSRIARALGLHVEIRFVPDAGAPA